jgi:hypothetical protein
MDGACRWERAPRRCQPHRPSQRVRYRCVQEHLADLARPLPRRSRYDRPVPAYVLTTKPLAPGPRPNMTSAAEIGARRHRRHAVLP